MRADLCARRGSHAPLFGGRNPRRKNKPPLRLSYPLLSLAPLITRGSSVLSPSLSFSLPSPFFLRRDDGFLPAPLPRLNPGRRRVASGEWSSGRRHECVSLVTNTAPRFILRPDSRRLAALLGSVAFSRTHARTPFRHVERARTDPRQNREVPGRSRRRDQLFPLTPYAFFRAERKAG